MGIYSALMKSHDVQRALCAKMLKEKDTEVLAKQFRKLVPLLSNHEIAETRFLFVPLEGKIGVQESIYFAVGEHHLFDRIMENIWAMMETHPSWVDELEELIEKLYLHMEREERQYFSLIDSTFSKGEQHALGEAYEAFMKQAATSKVPETAVVV